MIWNLDQKGSATALVTPDESYTYGQLADLVREIGGSIEPRKLVFSLCENAVGSVAGYLAFLDVKAVPLLLDAGIDRDLLSTLIDLYKPSYLWVPSALAADFPHCRMVAAIAGYELLDTQEANPPELHPDLALLMSTSGSTGSPKLVRLSYRNIEANTASIIEYLGITPEERAITSLQMSYVYGLSVLNTHIAAGASLLLTSYTCYSKPFWDLFEQQGGTSFAGVPFMYEMLDKLKFTKKMSFPTLRTMTQAGGKLSVPLQEKFTRYAIDHGVNFVVMYGASEATARMGYLPPNHSLDKLGSMGIVIPGGRFEIVDAEGHAIDEPDQAGELVYYGDNVSLGYSTCADDLAKGDERGGRLETGDMARRDADGYYYIVGRKKRFIKMLGKRTNLDELEMLLKTHLDTVDVACAGSDDNLCIFVVDADLADSAVSYIHEVTGINARQIAARVLDEIPKNTSGKTLYSKLNEIAANGEGR